MDYDTYGCPVWEVDDYVGASAPVNALGASEESMLRTEIERLRAKKAGEENGLYIEIALLRAKIANEKIALCAEIARLRSEIRALEANAVKPL